MPFWIGDRVAVVGGTYKGRQGTYRGDYGRVMCQVEIDGDERKTRNIWKTSISKLVKEEEDTGAEEMITISAREHAELLSEIRDLSAMVDRLKVKVENLK